MASAEFPILRLSPSLLRPIALAFVARAFLATGTNLTIADGHRVLSATVVTAGEWLMRP